MVCATRVCVHVCTCIVVSSQTTEYNHALWFTLESYFPGHCWYFCLNAVHTETSTKISTTSSVEESPPGSQD